MVPAASKPGRDPEKEYERICAKVRAYLKQASQNPSMSLTYEAIRKTCGVSRGHFAKPEYADLVSEIIDARAVQDALSDNEDTPLHATGVGPTDCEIEERIRFHAGAARDEMAIWLSRHKPPESPSQAPLMLHDLDMTIMTLRKHADALRPLVAEHVLRTEMAEDQNSVNLYGPLFDGTG